MSRAAGSTWSSSPMTSTARRVGDVALIALPVAVAARLGRTGIRHKDAWAYAAASSQRAAVASREGDTATR